MIQTVTLSDEHAAFVASEAAKAGLPGPADYILRLIEAERDRVESEDVLPLLLEALESGPATPMTPEDWASIREEARSRLAERVH